MTTPTTLKPVNFDDLKKQRESALNISTIEMVRLEACRADFVRYVVKEQAHRDPCYRSSLKAHRKGKQHGFDHPSVQVQWILYKAGWIDGRGSAS